MLFARALSQAKLQCLSLNSPQVKGGGVLEGYDKIPSPELAGNLEMLLAHLPGLDDGEGFLTDFNLDDSNSFGLKFVKSASWPELEGTLGYENSAQGGAGVKTTFPLADPSSSIQGLLQ